MKKTRVRSFVAWLALAFSMGAVATSSSPSAEFNRRTTVVERSDIVQAHIGAGALQNLQNSRGLQGFYSYGKGKGKGGYGGGYGYGYGYGYGSSKGSKSSKSGKGKGGAKSSKGYYPLPGKGSGEKSVNCKKFDYLSNYVPIYGKGKGKGKGYYGRQLQSEGGRQLQFEGEDCSPNTLDVAASKSELSIFVDLVHAAGLEDLFTCAGPFTILAPSNEAFSKNPELLDYLFDPHNREDLEETILYHIIPGFYLQSDFHDGPYRTLQRGTVEVSTYPFGFNQAHVTNADILGCNGVINIIDDVLIPQGNDYLPEECADLDFRQPGEFPFDIRTSGGFGGYGSGANGISSVYGRGFNRRKLQYQGHICEPNVLDVARQDPNLSTAVMLIEAAGLSDIFLCAGPFTFAIPNNAAFSQLNPSLLSSLMDPANVDTLRQILLYHLLPGAQFTASLQAGPQTTLQGEDVEISLNPTRFDDGEVVQPDNAACNGVYHVIDEVLIPPSIDEPTEPEVPEICAMLDFRALRRKLQFEGELCDPNVLEVARGDPDLSTFVMLAEQSGLDIIFLCAGPFTALLPTNAAFEALDDELLEFLQDPANVDALQELLLYHIVAGLELTTELVDGPLLTLQGDNVNAATNPVTFNGEPVLAADIPACNGVIDKLGGVLIPPSFIPETSAPTSPPLTLPPVMTLAPTQLPTASPTATPTAFPPGMTAAPTPVQTATPTATPTAMPPGMTAAPTPLDTPILETNAPTPAATAPPTPAGTPLTSTLAPTTLGPTTLAPTGAPIMGTLPPSTAMPTGSASTAAPTTAAPSTAAPTTGATTLAPTGGGSDAPSAVPSAAETLTRAPTSAPSTQGPTGQPTIELVRVRVTDYFIAYGVPGMTSEPTEDDLSRLLEETRTFWTGYFEDFYANDPGIKFNGMNLNIVETMFNAGIPEPQFNYWIEFDTVILYDLDTATPPGAMETFSIMSDADFVPYILDHVRSIPIFETCDEIDFRAIEMLVPASLSLDGAREVEQPQEGGAPVGILAAVGAGTLVALLAGVVLFKRKKERERNEFGKVVQEASSGSENTVTDETHSDSTFSSLVAALRRKKATTSTQH